MKKSKIIVLIIIIPLIFLWIYNLSNFKFFGVNRNFQGIQQSLIEASNTMRNTMFIAIPIIILGFSLYKIYIHKTRIFGVIPLNKLNQHIVILGSTGAGKTTIAKKIVKKLMKKAKKPIYIFDVFGEYSDLAEKEKIELIKFDDKTTFNIFDPWNIPIKKYIIFIINVLKDIFELSEPQTYCLFRALEEEYRQRKYFEESKEFPVPPDINNILERIRKLTPQSRFDYEIKVALEKLLAILECSPLFSTI